MNASDIHYFVDVFRRDTAPAFKSMPRDEITQSFCEMQCVLAGITVKRLVEESTPESRADFVKRWMDAAAARERAKAAPDAAATVKKSRRAKV